MNAHGKDNREDFIFPLAASLSASDMNKIVLSLYDEIKTTVAGMATATDKEGDKIRLKFANVFKALQKMGPEAKKAWNEVVKKPTDEEGLKLGGLLFIPQKFMTDKISESHASEVFKQSAASLKKEFAPITPLSESKQDSDSDSDLPSPRMHEEKSAMLGGANQRAISENALKREIYGVVAEQVLAAHEQALDLSYDQVAIIYQFGESIAKEVLRPSQAPGESKELNINQISATAMLDVFQESLARAFVEASISQKDKQQDSALPILRDMVTAIDKHLQELAKNRQVKIQGIVPLLDLSKEQKALGNPIDGVILGSIFPVSEKNATLRKDIPKFVSEMVDRIFEKATEILKRTPAKESDKRDFEHVVSTIMKMGVNFIREWNHKASTEFHELYIREWGDDARLAKSFDHIAKLAATTTEDQRRDKTVASAVNSFQNEMKDIPVEVQGPALRALMLANKSPAADRDELRLRLQSAIFDIFERAYEQGRVRSALGVSKATPYLEAVVNFIKKLDTDLLANGYRPLIYDTPAAYPADAIDCANLIFRQESKVLGKGFADRIQHMFNEVVANFKLANQAARDPKQIAAFVDKHDKSGQLYKAQEHFVNVMKAIQAMCGKEKNLNANVKAKELWNDCLRNAKKDLSQLGEFGALLTPLSLDKAVAIKEKNPKNEFMAVARVAEAFRPLADLFVKMKDNLGNKALLTDYIKNTKDMKNPFYAGRKALVEAFDALKKVDGDYLPFAKEVWVKLVEANAPRYGDALKKFLLMNDTKEQFIKDSFVGFLSEVNAIPEAQLAAKLEELRSFAVKESKEPSRVREDSLKSPREQSLFAHSKDSKAYTPTSAASKSKENALGELNPTPSPRPGSPTSSSSK
jgi:hypothetical protein